MQYKFIIEDLLNFLDINRIEYKYKGNRKQKVCGVSSFINYKKNTLTWIKSKDKFFLLKEKVDLESIDVVIVDYETQAIANFNNVIICNNPKYILSLIIEEFFKEDDFTEKIGKNTIIEDSAIIGKDVLIGNNCYIGNHVKIGDGTQIYHNVVINRNVVIGKNCCLKSGAVIGQDGYGYSVDEESGPVKVPHLGSVIIGDNVDIGANTCVDRGTINDTVIGDGSKIDNLCHIAHNVQIGKNVLIVAGTVVGGSTVLEDNVYLAPGAIVRNQLVIEEGSLIGMGSVVTKSTKKQYVYSGVPAHALRIRGDENL